MADARRALGDAGEAAAARWLEARGYRIVARKVRGRRGEIDLVVQGRGVVVFVEVKARSGSGYGHPYEAVDGRKRRAVAGLALAFLQAHGLLGAEIRFDVIAVHLGPGGRPDMIEHAPGAFDASSLNGAR